MPVYPSYPPVHIDGSERGPMMEATSRFAHIEALAARGLLDFAVIDPGSVNLSLTKTTAGAKPAGTYMQERRGAAAASQLLARLHCPQLFCAWPTSCNLYSENIGRSIDGGHHAQTRSVQISSFSDEAFSPQANGF